MKRVGIFIMAYEAVRTLIAGYERIPAHLKKEAAEIYIIDDASSDDTFWAGMGTGSLFLSSTTKACSASSSWPKTRKTKATHRRCWPRREPEPNCTAGSECW